MHACWRVPLRSGSARRARRRPRRPRSCGRSARRRRPRSRRAPTWTVKGQVTNRSRKRAKARVTLTLRTSKSAKAIKLTTKSTSAIKAGKTARYSVKVKLPASLKDGTYYVRACATLNGGADSCRYATRKLKVQAKKATPQPSPPQTNPAPAPTVRRPRRRPSEPTATATPTATAAPLPQPGVGDGPVFNVLVFTGTAAAASYQGGLDALNAVAKDGGFKVTQTGNASAFTESYLKQYRSVVFLGDIGAPLNAAQEAAFEAYYSGGGGFFAVGSAIESEPDWAYLTELLGTRADGAAVQATNATIKVADRVHLASRSLPEYWTRSDRFYNFKANVRGVAHVLATVDETTYDGGTMTELADHPVAWCKDYEGGRAFYTNVGASGDLSSAAARKHLAGAIQWTAGEADPVYSDCGATVLANYQQTKISVNPNLNEPIGIETLPDGRVLQTARGGQLRLHDPKDGSSKVIATLPVYTNSEDGLYGPAVDNDFATNKWVYLYYSPATVENVKQSDGTTKTITTPPNTSAPTIAPSLARLGRVRRLLPAQPLQVRRRGEPDDRSRVRAEDPARLQQPRRVLPRRR